ncbi:MAG: methylmalonyl-CoA epimerase [Candidatus Krumholzibacteria bacterium]
MLDRIDHIAIAVEDLDAALAMYQSLFELEAAHREYIKDFDVDIATFTIGNTEIELLEGRSQDSPIRKFVRKSGPGLHHIAFAVDDIRKVLARLKAEGVRLIDETPRRGKGNSLVAFVHPASTQNVLYELVQMDSSI